MTRVWSHAVDSAAPILARVSACSFPGIQQWSGVQSPLADQPSLNSCLTVSRACRANSVFFGLSVESVLSAGWLSTQIRVLGGAGSLSVLRGGLRRWHVSLRRIPRILPRGCNIPSPLWFGHGSGRRCRPGTGYGYILKAILLHLPFIAG